MSPGVVGYTYPPSPPYYMGRFSNGPNWVDVLSDLLEIDRPTASLNGGANYAYGGASTGSIANAIGIAGIDMDDQLATYFSEQIPTGDELFVIQATGNDFTAGQSDAAKPAAYLGRMLSDLATAGAEHVLISNAFGRSNDRRYREYDRFLSIELAELQQTHAELTIYRLDVMAIVDAVYSAPAAWDITSVRGRACRDCNTSENPEQIASNANEFMSWDGWHFTAPIHKAIGSAAFRMIAGPVLGDLDVDGVLSAQDIDMLAVALMSKSKAVLFDLNEDGSVDPGDYRHLVGGISGIWFGDANFDGEFNSNDLVTALAAGEYEDGIISNSGWAEGDWNADGEFTSADLIVALADGGYEQGPRPAAVPEPSSALLLVIGLLRIARRRR